MLLGALVFALVNPTKSEAKVMYDGAEVVKEQTGKMTFKGIQEKSRWYI
ncbi:MULTISPECIES: hypothetical protein [unclassified Lysinibacillus]|nr:MULTISPECIES: hypothetical protein [unclassified Lysinibacillus]MCL1694547.1 hypothetical protein [Lysinibacillus sp. BPa_S21]MCL1699380.1 hypothetical protein [Lysinibacillus sp. Bpr_S20]